MVIIYNCSFNGKIKISGKWQPSTNNKPNGKLTGTPTLTIVNKGFVLLCMNLHDTKEIKYVRYNKFMLLLKKSIMLTQKIKSS